MAETTQVREYLNQGAVQQGATVPKQTESAELVSLVTQVREAVHDIDSRLTNFNSRLHGQSHPVADESDPENVEPADFVARTESRLRETLRALENIRDTMGDIESFA